MLFQPGQSGNPKGRPRGARNRNRQILEAIEADDRELVDEVLKLAKGGNFPSLKFLLERMLPSERTIRLDLPDVRSLDNITQASAVVLAAMADGTVTPAEGARLLDGLAKHKQFIEAYELETRIAALEARLAEEEKS